MISLYNQCADWVGSWFVNLEPRTNFRPFEDFVVAPDSEFQKKVNEVFKGVIPWFHISRGKKGLERVPLLQRDPCVFKHAELPGYVFKTSARSTFQCHGVTSVKQGRLTTAETNLDRPILADALRKLVSDHNLDRLYVVKKEVVSVPTETWTLPEDFFRSREPFTPEKRKAKTVEGLTDEHKYMIAAEAMDLTSIEETKNHIQKMAPKEQETLLRQLFELFYLSGYQDGHYWNFAFAKSGPQEGKLILYDTESLGLVKKHQDFPNARKTGGLRLLDLECATYAMNEAMSKKEGLPFSEDIKNRVHGEYMRKIQNETQAITTVGKVALDTAMVAAVVLAAIPLAYSYS